MKTTLRYRRHFYRGRRGSPCLWKRRLVVSKITWETSLEVANEEVILSATTTLFPCSPQMLHRSGKVYSRNLCCEYPYMAWTMGSNMVRVMNMETRQVVGTVVHVMRRFTTEKVCIIISREENFAAFVGVEVEGTHRFQFSK